MMDIRRAAALLLALVMIAALTVGCGKKQSDPQIHPLPVRTAGLPPSSRRSWCATTDR